ncbi:MULTISPECIES: ammonium transporter [Methanobrevibacter]|uniref:ammonium transporter n=1 Tax=Methanobrevibacter TaxID=2172 RepID=UPI0015C12416|nr:MULTISPECIES: ammonium transporter [Methanobrevibacter]MCI7428717.1 ammonium transporter [Methanobrevibacter sp.]MDD6777183.1 ammonium transporter [Methanobacteriaceae archaeon]MDY3096319.1 ammonium transporter [Methanobrevibacter sp.]
MDVFSAGDTAWVLICTILVLLMSIPAVAFFYGGLCKRKNVLNTIFLTFIAFSIISVIWVIFGYQFAFGTDISGLIGSPSNFFLQGIGLDELSGTIPTLLFVMFQCAFAGLTCAIISGALVGRMKTKAWIAFTILWVCIVYVPIAHWVWGGGWLMQMGALDFAGGAVVHINSGISALAVALVLGRRKNISIPHNLGYAVLGAALLWIGWMGFNGGSGLAADGLAANAIIVSNVAAAVGLIVWTLIDTKVVGKPTVLGAISGAIAGLVGITPAAGFVDVFGALVIGAGASVVSYFAVYYLKPKLGYDDALDVWGIHGMSGVWGAIATGIFAVPAVNGAAGLIAGNANQLVVQIISVVVTIVYAFTISYILAKVLDKAMGGIRVEESEETVGLDTSLHQESAYNFN